MLLLAAFSFVSLAINAEVTNELSGKEKNAVLAFEELQYDFGKVPQGDVLEHLFKFTNSGNDKLVIQSVQPSCGCTGATIGDKKEFLPGETGEIKVTFNTQGREGVNSKTINVSSNDNSQPSITLSFTCEILNNK